MCPNHQDMMRQIILSVTTLGLGSMVLGQSIEVVLFQETGLEEATQTALTNYAEQTGVEMTFYEEVLDSSADPGNIQPCAVMDSILSQKDAAIFLGGAKPQHCNWADIVPQLHQFVQGGGTLIFQGPIADGGMAFFFEPDQWEQFDDDPWFGGIEDSQHWCCGLGVENANCGGGEELFGVSHVDHPIFSGAYNYPYGQQGACDMMIFEPSWYTLDAADLDDPRFFSILEFGQALNTDWVHGGEDTQMIFGKSVGAGHVVFYGENNPLPDPYTGSQTLLGNLIVYFSEEPGCTNENACNYDPEANVDNGTCASCEQLQTACLDGTVWREQLGGCVVANVSDTDFDGCVGINDFLVHLSNFGSGCGPEPAWACGDPLEYQGYDYETVQIGDQCWFAENLRSESYRNGDIIPVVPGSTDWLNQTQGAKCWHNNDSLSWGFPGFLYNGYAVNDPRSLCPQSWHVANDADWAGVEMSHGLSQGEAFVNGQRGSQIQLSQKMRDESWGFNELGLGIMPGGYREWDTGSFSSGGLVSGIFWSNGPTSLKYRECHGPWSGVARGNVGVLGGLSVRCIKDSE